MIRRAAFSSGASKIAMPVLTSVEYASNPSPADR
jgi:hypothetical protein